MKQLSKSERIQKEAQIKLLIRSATEYFYAEDLLELLVGTCSLEELDGLKNKCAEILLIDGDKYIAEVDLVTEVELKGFCKEKGIKLKGYFD